MSIDRIDLARFQGVNLPPEKAKAIKELETAYKELDGLNQKPTKARHGRGMQEFLQKLATVSKRVEHCEAKVRFMMHNINRVAQKRLGNEIDKTALLQAQSMNKSSKFQALETKLQNIGRWYTDKNPLLLRPDLKYSVRQSSNPNSYAVGVRIGQDSNSIKEIRISKKDFLAMTENLSGDQIANHLRSLHFQSKLQSEGRWYTPPAENPLKRHPERKFSVRQSSDPDSYAVGVRAGAGSSSIQEIRIKKDAFHQMLQNLSEDEIVNKLRPQSFEKVLNQITGDDAKKRLEKAHELSNEQNSPINMLLKDESPDAGTCLKLFAKILGCDPENIRALKKGYGRLSREIHPDKGGDPAHMQLLNTLYEKSGMK